MYRIQRADNVRFREEPFGGILLVAEYQLFGVDHLGKYIWQVCQDRTFEDLLTDPAIGSVSRENVVGFLVDLRAIGAISWPAEVMITDGPGLRDFTTTPKVFPFSWVYEDTYHLGPSLGEVEPDTPYNNSYACGQCSACSACSACG